MSSREPWGPAAEAWGTVLLVYCCNRGHLGQAVGDGVVGEAMQVDQAEAGGRQLGEAEQGGGCYWGDRGQAGGPGVKGMVPMTCHPICQPAMSPSFHKNQCALAGLPFHFCTRLRYFPGEVPGVQVPPMVYFFKPAFNWVLSISTSFIGFIFKTASSRFIFSSNQAVNKIPAHAKQQI